MRIQRDAIILSMAAHAHCRQREHGRYYVYKYTKNYISYCTIVSTLFDSYNGIAWKLVYE